MFQTINQTMYILYKSWPVDITRYQNSQNTRCHDWVFQITQTIYDICTVIVNQELQCFSSITPCNQTSSNYMQWSCIIMSICSCHVAIYNQISLKHCDFRQLCIQTVTILFKLSNFHLPWYDCISWFATNMVWYEYSPHFTRGYSIAM